jgi:hypothetical protein
MAAADFVAYTARPGYVLVNSLKGSDHFPGDSSCYCNSCHKIILCLHCSLIHLALHVPQRKKSSVFKTGGEGARLLGLLESYGLLAFRRPPSYFRGPGV